MEEYYNPRTGLGSAHKFYKSQSKLSYAEVKSMLAKQEAYQLNQQGGKVEYFPIWGRGAGSYQADLMFPPAYRGFDTILCIINVNTRVAACYAQKGKSADVTFGNLKRWLDGTHGVSFIQTDNGREFLNAKVKRLFEERGVTFDTVEPGDHDGQGKVERFNETLRRLITVYTDGVQSDDWVSVLDDLVWNYNHRYHRALKMAPSEADESTGRAQQWAQYQEAKKQFDRFAVGDTVRVLRQKGVFDKGRKQWSKDTHEIDAEKGHLFHVEGVGWKKHYELLKVSAVERVVPGGLEKQQQAKKEARRTKRAQTRTGVEANRDEFDGSAYVGRRVHVPKSHFKGYKGSQEYFDGTVASYKKTRGDARKNYDWRVVYDNGLDETMNLRELEDFVV